MERDAAIQQRGGRVLALDVLNLMTGANAAGNKAVAAHILAVHQSFDKPFVQRIIDFLEVGLNERVIVPAHKAADAEPAILGVGVAGVAGRIVAPQTEAVHVQPRCHAERVDDVCLLLIQQHFRAVFQAGGGDCQRLVGRADIGNNSITVGKIFSIHYFEYMSNFKFSGEAHNFWEFVYIDKGEAGITHNKSYTVLHKGELFFHKPNEFHSVRATGTIAPNLIVISFECNDKAMNFFNNRRMKIDETAQTLLANIIIEAKRCFNCRLDDPYLQNMPLKDTDIFGSQQMIRLYLEHFLIHLIRCYSQSFLQHKKLSEAKLPKATKTNNDTETFNKIIDYLNRHITSHVTIDLICKDNLIGRSQLQKLFKEQCNRGIIEYFSILKIEVAKELIRTNHMNFTQISAHLGYTSIHYFSRQFKKIVGMTPSEYASSVKAIAEGNAN